MTRVAAVFTVLSALAATPAWSDEKTPEENVCDINPKLCDEMTDDDSEE